jgi:hypothetical protein
VKTVVAEAGQKRGEGNFLHPPFAKNSPAHTMKSRLQMQKSAYTITSKNSPLHKV